LTVVRAADAMPTDPASARDQVGRAAVIVPGKSIADLRPKVATFAESE
jgi:hypothetical protein